MSEPSSVAAGRNRRTPKRSIRTVVLAVVTLVVGLVGVPAAAGAGAPVADPGGAAPAAADPAGAAAELAGADPALAKPGAPRTVYRSTADSATLTVGAGRNGYRVEIDKSRFQLTTRRAGAVVLATVDAPIPAYDFRAAGSSTWVGTTSVRSASWNGHTLTLVVNTTNPDYSVLVTIDPGRDRYALNAVVQGVTAAALTVHYDMAASGHWYGHGEAATPNGGPYTDQPWPLDSGPVLDTAFGPASYDMVEPFWFTSKASGILIDTDQTMTVSLGAARAGEAGFQLDSGKPLEQTVFVEQTPADVYHDYVGITGTPTKSDAPDYQYESTVWNSWAQFYTSVTQSSFLDWADSLHASGIPAHTFNLDDGWMSHYGDFTFNSKFPDPKAMVDQIHSMGYKFGLWVTLWLNTDSQNYQTAKANGWLLKSASDPSQPCDVTWWNGTAGIVDLANPAAKAWYEGQLNSLVGDLGVDGFKFDTRFFDESCAPYSSDLSMSDYQTLGAQLADQYDLQGMGIRVHWTGSQQYGFVTREVDKGTNWKSLQAGMHQLLALSTTGHQFVTSDMIGGSLGNPPPTKQVLVRWAQASALTPLMYSSTAPTGVTDSTTGAWVPYDDETVQLYKQAVEQHGALAPYILRQKDRAVATGEPMMKPLFWDFPKEQPTYTVDDEWLLGDSLLAAPVLDDAVTRDIYLPKGKWFDPYHRTTITGGRWVRSYPAPLNVTPMFIRQGGPDYRLLKAALAGVARGAGS
ncbi:TIM-barrel domain-containing protein [Nakamurella lactea]|uniref:TIM-barrel domain-containing protein n=1 Tax=Nakamurella lactea TaxID=459515 RepID=UPI0004086280|nr:TIM-barrel domain-containing protein [Nakamurella lactea]